MKTRALTLAATALIALTGCTTADLNINTTTPALPTSTQAAETAPGDTTPNPNPQNLATAEEIATAKTLLPTLPVVHQDSSGYNRTEQFGKAWAYDAAGNERTGHSACNTRNEILHRDLTNITADRCKVLTGTLDDPYTGTLIDFVQGKDTSMEVQIEHIVALNDAWGSGAREWSQQQRLAFANDPANLIAVDGPENSAKGAKDAAQWAVPNNPAYTCTYLTRQITLKAHYGLSIDKAEADALNTLMATC